MSEKVSVYYLEVHDPSEGKNQVRVHGEISLGSAHSNSICVEEVELAPKHCVFRVHQEVLTVFQVAESGTSKIGRQSLDAGRMYILEKGDKLTLGELKIVVRLEKEIIEEALPDDEDELEDITDPNVGTPALDQDEEAEDEEEHEAKPSFFSKLKARFKRAPKEDIDESDEEEIEELSEDLEDEEGAEEEEKTDEIKNSIYIPKAKVDEEDEEDKKPAKKKKPKIRINRDDIPAFFARLYAFLAEIIIAFAFVANIAPILELEAIYTQLNNDLVPLVQKGLDLAGPLLGEHAHYLDFLKSFSFLSVFVTWFALNLVSSLIMGATLGLALLSVRTEGSFVTARVKALARFLLSLITLPTVITELPALIKKRTLKEVITASEISYRHPLLKILGVLIILPAFTLASIALPGLMTPDLLETPTLMKDLVVKDTKTDQALQTHPWRKLKLAISYPQNIMNEWAFSPTLSEKNGRISAAVRALRSRGENVDIVTVGPLSYNNIPVQYFQAVSNLDPFFANKYPKLHEELLAGNITTLSDQDAIALIIDSLAINWEELPRFISERGPILTPYLNLKKYLTETFAITSSVQATLIGRRTFIEFAITNNKHRLMAVIDGRLTQLDLASRGNAEVALAKFKRTFFENAAPLMDDAVSSANNNQNWVFLDWLDHFNESTDLTLGEGINGISKFMNEVLATRERHPWAMETIENDYRDTMRVLKSLGEAGNQDWAMDAFNAMNAAPDVWQREDTPAQESAPPQEEQPQQ